MPPPPPLPVLLNTHPAVPLADDVNPPLLSLSRIHMTSNVVSGVAVLLLPVPPLSYTAHTRTHPSLHHSGVSFVLFSVTMLYSYIAVNHYNCHGHIK